MNKLLAPLTLLFLVACQPSELKRCVKANTEPTPINDYEIKEIKYQQTIKDIATKFKDGEISQSRYNKSTLNETRYFWNSLNPLEEIVKQCRSDAFDLDYVDGLTVSEQREYRKEIIQSCMSSTENQVKELQLKIKKENREKAKSICHSQGIY